MKCPKCNHELPDDSGFCTECGTDLDDAVKAAEEPVVEASAAEESAAEAPAEPPVEEPAIEEPAPAEQLPEVPEKKSKTGLIIGAVAAVILAAIGIFMAIGGGGDPKETVINAFKSVYSAETVYPIEELFGFEEMAKASVEGKYESGMSFILSGLDPAMDADMLLGGGITIDAQSDTPNKKSAATVGIEYNDMSLVSMDLYVDDTNMMVKIPEMSDTVFTLNYKDDLAGQIANSPYIGQMLAEEDRAMVEQYFATLSEAIEQSSNAGSAYPFDFEALWNRYKEGTQAIETLKTAMTVEKGSKKTCVVDLQETDCAGYQVTIPAGEVVKFIETTADFFLNDETFKTEFLTYMEQTMQASLSMQLGDEFTAETYMNEIWTTLEESKTVLVDGLTEMMGDVTMDVYVDKDGRLAEVVAVTALTDPDSTEVMNLSMEAQLKGGTYLTQNVDASLEMDAAGEVMTLTLKKEGSYDGKKLTSDVTFDLSDPEVQAVGIRYSGAYDSADGSYDMEMGISTMDQELMSFVLNGTVDSLEKGKSMEATIDSMGITAEGVELIELTGDFYMKPFEGEVTALEGSQLDVLASTEEDWQTVIMEAYGALLGLVMQFSY